MINKTSKKLTSVFQILILVVGIIAISWAVGSSVEVVSANDDSACTALSGKCADKTQFNCDKGTWKAGKCLSNSNVNYQCCVGGTLNSIKSKQKPEPQTTNIPADGIKTKKWNENDFNNAYNNSKNHEFKTEIDKYKKQYNSAKGNKIKQKDIAKNAGEYIGRTLGTATSASATRAAMNKIGLDKTMGSIFSNAVAEGGGAKSVGYLTKLFAGHGAEGAFEGWGGTGGLELGGTIVSAVVWAGVTFLIGRYVIGPLLGMSTHQSQALGYSVGSTVFTGITAVSAIGGPVGWVIGAGVGSVVFIITYKKESAEIVSFQCNSWGAESGGENCDECNHQGILPCTEYQCKSLGRSCEYLNKGTGKEVCVFVDSEDTNPPVIKPLVSALLDGYEYKKDNAVLPPDKGVKLIYKNSQDGCFPSFSTASFGVTLDEPAKCKISTQREPTFEDMGNLFLSNGIDAFNHSFETKVIGQNELESENISLNNGGNYEFYVRCEDQRGNFNIGNAVFKFCVDSTSDMIAPTILNTNPLNNAPIASNTTSVKTSIYLNKPSSCKWAHLDQSYDDMENEMDCESDILGANSKLSYTCTTELTGFKDRVKNNFYFRCKSYPNKNESQRVEMQESYHYKLQGTEPLIITSAEPNNTEIRGSRETVKINLKAKTFAGADEGKSMCSYSSTENGDYLIFFGDENFDKYEHSQELWQSEGEHTYFIKCCDLGGNCDTKKINFTIKVDREMPMVVRAYYESNYLKLVTDEKAECVYSTFGCDYNFDDGTAMKTLSDVNHFTDWNSNNYFYIKCKDQYGNQPNANDCSIIAKPFEI